MKQLLTLILILNISIVMSQSTLNYKVFENQKEGVSIKYPETWSNVENPKTVFILMRPFETNGQTFRENVNLTITSSNGVKLKKYSEMSLSQMGNYLKEYKIESTVFLKLNGKEYAKTIYTHVANGFSFKVALYQIILNGKGYNITCTALFDTYNKFASVFEIMVASFSVK